MGEKNQPVYSDVIDKFARVSNLLQVEPSGDAKTVKITFDILMRKNMEPSEFSQQIAELEEVTEVVLVASKHDVDY